MLSVNAVSKRLRATGNCSLPTCTRIGGLVQRGCVGVHVTYAAWGCNVLQGAAGVSDTMLLVLVRPACTG